VSHGAAAHQSCLTRLIEHPTDGQGVKTHAAKPKKSSLKKANSALAPGWKSTLESKTGKAGATSIGKSFACNCYSDADC